MRKIDIGALLQGLADGRYKIRMRSRGCRWWWHEEVGKEEGEDEGRLRAHSCGIVVSPLMLESRDEVELRVRNGMVDRSM